MTRILHWHIGLLLAVACVVCVAHSARAQESAATEPDIDHATPPAQSTAEPADTTAPLIEELIVTGSYIKGSSIDTASPVSVITRTELESQGSPTMVELIQKMEFSSGRNHGQSNHFQNNSSQGVASVNLRGLGSNRTLVLINGRRQVASPFRRGFVDINQIPLQALQRVEILKEGASATYGSDAISGVVNFITDNRYEGFALTASYQEVNKAEDPDIQRGFKWGGTIGDTHLVITYNKQIRGELKARSRNFAVRPYGTALGWSTIGNPGALMPVDPASELALGLSNAARDPECETLGGSEISNNRCAFQYIRLDNLTEDETHRNLFAEVTHEFADASELNASLLYHYSDIPTWATSPSYPPQELQGAVQYVPPNHPGLVDMIAKYPSVYEGDGKKFKAEGGVFWGRLLGSSGRPNGGDARRGHREYHSWRLAAQYTRTLSNGIDLNASIVYAEQTGEVGDYDELLANTALAFRGYGGAGCGATAHLDKDGHIVVNPNGATAGEESCHWYNPFSNAIARSAINGAVSEHYSAKLANDPQMLDWLQRPNSAENTTTLSVAEVIANGDTDAALGGGVMQWAAGLQLRSFNEELINGRWNDLDAMPCQFSWNGVEYVDVVNDTTQVANKSTEQTTPLNQTQSNCTSTASKSPPSGPFNYLAAFNNYSESQDIVSVFGEFALPLASTLDIQIALRYEDYGEVGASTDPKISLRYTPAPWFTLRASASTTFRGPVAYESSNAKFTARQFIGVTGSFKPVDTSGNPLIEPEKALTYNIGMVMQSEKVEFSLDFWTVKLQDPIVIESHNQIVDRYRSEFDRINAIADKPSLSTTPTSTERTALKEFWQTHLTTKVAEQITCAGGITARALLDSATVTDLPCVVADLTRIGVRYVNGPDTDVGGIDMRFRFFLETGFEWGVSASYLSEYQVGAYINATGEQIAPAAEYVGTYNYGASTPIPRWKGKGWLQYRWSNATTGTEKSMRVQFNYIPRYDDHRTRAANSYPEIGRMTTADAVFGWTMGVERVAHVAIAVYNLLDVDPPKAHADFGYDPFTHNPFGRMLKVDFRYSLPPVK